MSDVIETEEYKGFTIEIFQDVDSESPRAWDNLGVLYTWHSRYDLGDAHEYPTPSDAERDVPRGSVVLPVYMYEHGGITISTTPFSCQWDSGQVGFIFVSPEKIRSELSRPPRRAKNKAAAFHKFKPIKRISDKDRARVADCLRSEIETLDQYLRGEVYGYAVLDADGETLDSCFGFYGLDYCLEEARHAAEHEERAALPLLFQEDKQAAVIQA